jgi:hypothetical protein
MISKLFATGRKLDYWSAVSKMFWGEQPPVMSIGRGGRYFFGDTLHEPGIA